jgi:predicted tellurium resistance membrane protein TerC
MIEAVRARFTFTFVRLGKLTQWQLVGPVTCVTVTQNGSGGSLPGEGMTFGAALVQSIIADVSMSLDNVLAVAGAAKGQIWMLAVDLTVAGASWRYSRLTSRNCSRAITGSHGSGSRLCSTSRSK